MGSMVEMDEWEFFLALEAGDLRVGVSVSAVGQVPPLRGPRTSIPAKGGSLRRVMSKGLCSPHRCLSGACHGPSLPPLVFFSLLSAAPSHRP